MRTVLLGIVLAASGVGLAIGVLLPWFSAELPERSITAAGIEVSGELWLLPLLGAAVLCAGIAIVAGARPAAREWAGLTAVGAGLLAAALAMRTVLLVPVSVAIRDGGETVPVSIEAEPLPLSGVSVLAALVAVVAGGIVHAEARRSGHRR